MTYRIQNRDKLPTEFQTLLADYPRDVWPDHPNFARSIQNWLGAHQMFRNLGEKMVRIGEKLVDKQIEPEKYADALSYYGSRFVGNLHGHHHWEDSTYFPELMAADPRFERGLEMLETDHEALDNVLDRFTKSGNRTLELLQRGEAKGVEEARTLLGHSRTIRKFLSRHLSDEEELVVPILLHHKMRS